MNEDLSDHDGIDDEADDSSLAIALTAVQDVHEKDPLDEFGPGVVLRALLSWLALRPVRLLL